MELTQHIPLQIRKDWLLNISLVLASILLALSLIRPIRTQKIDQTTQAVQEAPLVRPVTVSSTKPADKLKLVNTKPASVGTSKASPSTASVPSQVPTKPKTAISAKATNKTDPKKTNISQALSTTISRLIGLVK